MNLYDGKKLLVTLALSGAIFLQLLTSTASACSGGPFTCTCGESGTTVSISCTEDHEGHEDPCDHYNLCETCENDVDHCITCPIGHSGPFCDEEGNTDHSHNDSEEEAEIDVVRRQLSCPDLKSPKLGSVTCVQRGYEKVCTGRCHPGHKFERGTTETRLVCHSGVWTPYSSFPDCQSEGYCQLQISGGGSYNCTIGIQGTTCDVRCHGGPYRPVSGKYHCYPGSSWDPPLPYCAEEKAIGKSRHTCECRNGGFCDFDDGRCTCPPGFRGRLCELRGNEVKRQCSHPGQVDNGEVKTLDGNLVTRNQMFSSGSSVVFSCNSGHALVGESLLTCNEAGIWSSSVPRCHSNRAETAFCQNPGDITNGMRTVVPFLDPRTRENGNQDAADLPEGVKITYSCLSGFSLQGSSEIECTSRGTWYPEPPTCGEQKAPGCGHSYYRVTGKIFNGEKTVEGEWPWQVAYATTTSNGMDIRCGAVLINHRTALTAAHCVNPRSLGKIYLYFGKYHADFKNDDDQVVSRKASEFVVHPRFNRRNLDNDIALIRFEPEVTYTPRIQPICLPTPETTARNLRDGAKGTVTGWGTTETGASSDAMLMAELPIISTRDCRNAYRRQNLAVVISDNMFCAGYESGEVDSCSGDSGGPMVFYNSKDETYILEGIVSFGVKGDTGSCGQKNRYGVYAKVSNFVSWIEQNI